MLTPTEITRCNETDLDTASFDFYSGIAYAKEKNLIQSSSMTDLRKGTHFVVCCGDVMVKVASTDYPELIRRVF